MRIKGPPKYMVTERGLICEVALTYMVKFLFFIFYLLGFGRGGVCTHVKVGSRYVKVYNILGR